MGDGTDEPDPLGERYDDGDPGGDDPIERHATLGDALRAKGVDIHPGDEGVGDPTGESEGDYTPDPNRLDDSRRGSNAEADPREKLRRIKAAKEGGD